MGKWYEEAIVYHMYPIGMTGAPRENQEITVNHRLPELGEWLPYVHELGCDAIYIGPLFECLTHGYDTTDYRLVDRRLGDNEDFKNFVKQAHEQGIKIIVDGVFNHTGRSFFAFTDICKQREQSPYCNWYKGINFAGDTPYQDGFSYEAWRGCFELVNLNLQEQAVRDYLLEVIQFWITEFDIDGIRLDCADCLDFGFLEQMRSSTTAWKPDFWLMGEVIHGDYARYIGDGEQLLHSVTNYELHKALYSGHNDYNYFEIAHTARREFDAQSGIYRQLTLYSFVDNHDVDRLASKLHHQQQLKLVYLLMYLLPGIPSLYYGSEWGIAGQKQGPDDDGLRPAVTFATALEQSSQSELTAYIRWLGSVRKRYQAAVYGRYQELYLTNRQYAFGRIAGDEALIVVANNDEQPVRLVIPTPIAGKEYRNVATLELIAAEGNNLIVNLDPYQGVVLTSAERG